MTNLLEIKNLSVEYRTAGVWVSAVHNLSLALQDGEVFALVGESGCGKSTTAFAMSNLLDRSSARVSGEVHYRGASVLGLKPDDMAELRGREIGMIFQNPLDSLNPVYQVGVQVQEALLLDQMSPQQAWERTLASFKEVRIPDSESRLKNYPHELSGGMRQRVMISMMICRKPRLLIADEPTTALDVTIEAQILDIIRQLKQKYGTTILLITHNFGTVAELADRVGVMYGGTLVEIGNVYDLFKHPSHPYTQMLLRALPTIRKHEGRLQVIEGTVPRFTADFQGCRFQQRCPLVQEICLKSTPQLEQVGADHQAACHMIKQKDEAV